MKTIKHKRLEIESENLKDDGGIIVVLPTAMIAIDTENKELIFSIACLWYVFTIRYYYGKNLDCYSQKIQK